ncbi:CHAT domain-containing protein [[Phormidium ambiguum] IAM M-71]|uniref:CHAT domain-containing protein n=1 Tax=[Phormidium ambiguum] IAM M-71 TaxID=454136 RepID=UPI0015B7A5FA|nr:tetratricopeptide repeat protein [Phormidium ambiguum]
MTTIQTKSTLADWDFSGKFKPQNFRLSQISPDDRKTEAETSVKTGLQQLENNQPEAAIKSFEQALTIYQEIKDSQREGETLKNLGNAYMAAGNNTKAMEIYQQSLRIAKEIKNPDLEARVLQNIGTIYRLQEDYVEAAKYLESALLIAKEFKNQEIVLKALVSLGIVYDSLSNYQKVVEYYEQLLPIIKETNNPQLAALTLVTLGYAYTTLGNEEKGIEFGEPGLKLAKEIKQPELEAIALVTLGSAYLGLENYQKAVEFAEPGLAMIKQIKNPQMELVALITLGFAYTNLKDYQKATEFGQSALTSARELKNRIFEGRALVILGLAYVSLEEHQKAVEFAQQGLVIARELKIPEMEVFAAFSLARSSYLLASTPEAYQKSLALTQETLAVIQKYKHPDLESYLNSQIGENYNNLGEYEKAIAFAQKGLTLAREVKDKLREAYALLVIGQAYYQIAKTPEEYKKSLEFIQSSLNLAREIKEPSFEALALIYLANIYSQLEEYQKTLEFAEQSLKLSQEIKNTKIQVFPLINLLGIYVQLGEYKKVIELGEKGLTNIQPSDNPIIESVLNIILSIAYFGEGDYQKTIAFTQQALTQSRNIKNPQLEAYSLLVSGIGYASLNDNEKAIELFQQSLAKAKEQKDEILASTALNMLGGMYRKIGRKNEAIALYQEAIAIDSDYSILAGIGRVYRDLNSPVTAITYYKQAINEIEQVRGKISGLPVALQKSFLQAIQSVDRIKTADIYRELADLLMTQGRILEAQQVLELLKTEELREYTRSGSTSNTNLVLNQTETKIIQENGSLIQFGQKLFECQLTQCNQLSQLLDKRDVLISQFNQKVQTIEKEIRERRAQDDAFFDPNKISKTKEIVESQPATVLIYPLVLEDKVWLLLASPGGVVKTVEVPVNRRELGETVVKFRQLLQQPNSSVSEIQATGKKLYDWLIKPLETELKTSNVQNLIFSLDRVTRYIPMSALFDGEKYLIENYNISTVLSADLTDMRDRLPPGTEKSSILALGLSNAVADFNPLPYVPTELDAIVRQKPEDPKGIYPGLEFLNQTFDFKALRDNLTGRNILHIATHGKFVPGSPDASYLLLGNGAKLTIPDIQKLQGLSNIHLVVLSACETALGGPNAEGIEISGLSYYFLNGGAKSVMASLWQVNDGSTSQLMQNFYSNLANNTNDTAITKAAALRQAQLKFLRSNESADNIAQRGITTAQPVKSNLSHPYYWAPFVLIGNSR